MTVSLAAIETADKAATPGPWRYPNRGAWRDLVMTPNGCVWNPTTGRVNDDDDAKLIALYRNATPALVKALRAVLALCPTENPELIEAEYAVPAYLILEAIADAGVTP